MVALFFSSRKQLQENGRSPFPNHAIYDPSRLIGRSKELGAVKSFALADDESVLIMKGRKGVGKSSVLLSSLSVFTEKQKKRVDVVASRVLPIYVPLDAVMTTTTLAYSIGVAVESTFSDVVMCGKLPSWARKFQKKVAELEGSEKKTAVQVPIPYLPVPIEHGGKGHPLYTQMGLRGIVEALSVTAKYCKVTTVLLVFDEAQIISNWKQVDQEEFLQILKYISDNKRNIKVILTGSEIRLVNELVERGFTRVMQGRHFSTIEVDPLTKSGSDEFIKAGFSRAGISLPNPVLTEVVAMAYDSTLGLPRGLVTFGNEFVGSYRNYGLSERTSAGPGNSPSRPSPDREAGMVRLVGKEAAARAARVVEEGDVSDLVALLRTGVDENLREDCSRVVMAVALAKALDASAAPKIVGLSQERVDMILAQLISLRVLRLVGGRTYAIGDKLFEGIGCLERTEWKLANHIFETGSYERAVKVYDQAISESIAPKAFPAVFFNRALAWRMLGGFFLAFQDLETILPTDTSIADIYVLQGDMYESMGRLPKAIEMYQKATATKPDYQDAQDRLRSLVTVKEKRLHELDLMSKADKATAAYHAQAAKYYLDYDELEKALEHCDSALAIDSNNAWYYHLKDRICARLGRLQEKLEASRKSHNLEPGEQIYASNFGYELVKSGSFQEGLKCLETAVALNPLDAYTTLTMAEGLVVAGKAAEASLLIERGIRSGNVSPNDIFVEANKDALGDEACTAERSFLTELISSPLVNPVLRDAQGS